MLRDLTCSPSMVCCFSRSKMCSAEINRWPGSHCCNMVHSVWSKVTFRINANRIQYSFSYSKPTMVCYPFRHSGVGHFTKTAVELCKRYGYVDNDPVCFVSDVRSANSLHVIKLLQVMAAADTWSSRCGVCTTRP